MKILFVDTETTGLNSDHHDITEIACYFKDSLTNKNSKFHSYIFYNDYPSDYNEVVKITGLTPEILKEKGKPAQVVFVEFTRWLGSLVDQYNQDDKLIMAGYNVNFDDNFIRNFFSKNNHEYYGSFFYNARLDVMSFVAAAIYYNLMPIPKSFRLECVAEIFNIKFESHNAWSDVLATGKVYKKLMDRFFNMKLHKLKQDTGLNKK